MKITLELSRNDWHRIVLEMLATRCINGAEVPEAELERLCIIMGIEPYDDWGMLLHGSGCMTLSDEVVFGTLDWPPDWWKEIYHRLRQHLGEWSRFDARKRDTYRKARYIIRQHCDVSLWHRDELRDMCFGWYAKADPGYWQLGPGAELIDIFFTDEFVYRWAIKEGLSEDIGRWKGVAHEQTS